VSLPRQIYKIYLVSLLVYIYTHNIYIYIYIYIFFFSFKARVEEGPKSTNRITKDDSRAIDIISF
jgi:hypothetical protein